MLPVFFTQMPSLAPKIGFKNSFKTVLPDPRVRSWNEKKKIFSLLFYFLAETFKAVA
jgi:hypothetical protein